MICLPFYRFDHLPLQFRVVGVNSAVNDGDADTISGAALPILSDENRVR
jgi:hypothetical protein